MSRFGLSVKTIAQICDVFKQYPCVDKVILYGSRAKGNYKPGSDIDLTMIGNQITDEDYTSIFTDLDDLYTPYTFDLSLHRQIDNEDLKAHVDQIGIMFYER